VCVRVYSEGGLWRGVFGGRGGFFVGVGWGGFFFFVLFVVFCVVMFPSGDSRETSGPLGAGFYGGPNACQGVSRRIHCEVVFRRFLFLGFVGGGGGHQGIGVRVGS